MNSFSLSPNFSLSVPAGIDPQEYYNNLFASGQLGRNAFQYVPSEYQPGVSGLPSAHDDFTAGQVWGIEDQIDAMPWLTPAEREAYRQRLTDPSENPQIVKAEAAIANDNNRRFYESGEGGAQTALDTATMLAKVTGAPTKYAGAGLQPLGAFAEEGADDYWSQEIRAGNWSREDVIDHLVAAIDRGEIKMEDVPDVFRDDIEAFTGLREAGKDNLTEQARKYYEGEIGRLQGFVDKPSTMYSDAELGQRLRAVEGAINQEIGTIRTGAAKTLASSGLRSAGKVSNPVRTAEQLGRYQSGQNFQNVLGEVGATKRGLEGDWLNTQNALIELEGDIRSGRGANLTALTSQIQGLKPIDYSSPYLTYLDVNAMNEASRLSNSANLQNWVFGGINAAQQGVGQFTSMIPYFAPKG